VIDRLLREDLREIRWFGIWNLGSVLPTDPERAWQLLRRAAREADEWITVDTLAHPYGEGILLDARRWAELEQLVYSPSRWERRLVGSTVANAPLRQERSRRSRPPPRRLGASPVSGSSSATPSPMYRKLSHGLFAPWCWQIEPPSSTFSRLRPKRRGRRTTAGAPG